MNKQQFIENLKTNNLELAVKLECCQFFVNSFPVLIDQNLDPYGHFKTGNKYWTKLEGITISGGNEQLINHAFNSLVNRVKELEEFG